MDTNIIVNTTAANLLPNSQQQFEFAFGGTLLRCFDSHARTGVVCTLWCNSSGVASTGLLSSVMFLESAANAWGTYLVCCWASFECYNIVAPHVQHYTGSVLSSYRAYNGMIDL